MPKIIAILLLLCSLSIEVNAQQLFPIYQDTNRIQLNEVVILNPDRFGNDTLAYRFNQMKFYVGQILPYLDKAVKMFYEMEQETKTMTRRQKRRYLENRQHEIKINFEDKLRSLNTTQGKYLVIAINRNLGTTIYDILKGFNKPLKALYYRGVGNFYGIGLAEKYEPEQNKNFEKIMRIYGY